jgi:hypothetical protein
MKNATAMLGAQINEAPRWFQLFSVEYVHPGQGFSLAYLAQVHLGGLEILVPCCILYLTPNNRRVTIFRTFFLK